MTNYPEQTPPLINWRILAVVWGALSLLPVLPSFQDGALSNLSPMAFAYVALLWSPALALVAVLPWVCAHLGVSLSITALLGVLRRRAGARRFRLAVSWSAVAALVLGIWLVRVCWPAGIFFDASNVYYDVSDLVQSPTSPNAPFGDAEAVAKHVRNRTAPFGKHHVPDRIVGLLDTPTIVAWGTWPEHYRLRRKLEAVRRE